VIEAVTDRTAWTVNNSRDIEMAQGLSAAIRTESETGAETDR
jgi:aldehyde dehydrogenase (NAD+)